MAVQEEKFLQIYGNLLVRLWNDDDLKKRFKENPGEVLKEYGLDPGNAKIEVIQPTGEPNEGECTPESAAKMWNDGLKTGTIKMVFPENPPEGVSEELTEEQLEDVAGGGEYCCCCSPCCCC